MAMHPLSLQIQQLLSNELTTSSLFLHLFPEHILLFNHSELHSLIPQLSNVLRITGFCPCCFLRCRCSHTILAKTYQFPRQPSNTTSFPHSLHSHLQIYPFCSSVKALIRLYCNFQLTQLSFHYIQGQRPCFLHFCIPSINWELIVCMTKLY